MADFPNSTFAPATLTDNVDDVLASHQNLPNAEIVAIENYLLNIATGPAGHAHNYVITPSVSASDLTIALKGIDGNDPSATNPLRFRIGNSMFKVTAATSFTKNDGTNWCNAGAAETAAQNIDFFMYAIAETGASAGIKFGFSRISYANTMSDFVNTTTSEKYIAGNWTNFNASDIVQNIGRFRAQLSATAAFLWSIPSALVINRPVFNTDRLDWTPSFTGFSVNPTGVHSYSMYFKKMFVDVRHATNGTSNAVSFYMSMPFTPLTLANAKWTGSGQFVDNGTVGATPALCVINSGVARIDSSRAWTGTDDWTNAGNKRMASMSMNCDIG